MAICIFAPGSMKTLCGGKVTNFSGYFESKTDCAACLIRQDAMFAREYKQTLWRVCYNDTQYKAIKHGEIGGSIWIKGGTYIASFLGWDTASIRGAIKLGKLGVHDMGLAK